MKSLLPTYRQWISTKRRYPNAIAILRATDIYEVFGGDAITIALALNLTVSTRDMGDGESVSLCQIPVPAIADSLRTLVACGHQVAICEQVDR